MAEQNILVSRKVLRGIFRSCDFFWSFLRSSFNDSLHLMPNGFRRPKINRDQFNLDEFRLRPPVMTNNSRKSLRRGSMPINDYMRRGSLGMGILEHLNTRRGMDG